MKTNTAASPYKRHRYPAEIIANTVLWAQFFRKLLKGCQYVPRVLITDKLASYDAAKREILMGVEHRQHKRLNNRAENSHQPTRKREQTMRHFTSAGHAQRFAQGAPAPTASFGTISVPVGIACKRTPTKGNERNAVGDSWYGTMLLEFTRQHKDVGEVAVCGSFSRFVECMVSP